MAGNTVATAWVEILPEMSGIQGKISKELGAPADKAGEAAGKSSGGRFSAAFGAAMGVAQAVTQKAMSAISSSIGSAVARVDTLNNFPRVMQSLGYSAGESQAVIDQLSDRLSALPTKLDDITSSVQQLAPSSESLTQAKDRALAFNDALLAGGGSADTQKNALTQLTKAVSTGKMEMDAWMSIQEAMPGQLTQVAKAMLGQSASASDLYDAMKDGKVTVGQFADAIVELDQKGGDGVASFYEQALNATGGISTAFSNMRNAVTKGVAKVIDTIGAENIVAPINAAKAAINGAFAGVVAGIEWAQSRAQGIRDAFEVAMNIDGSPLAELKTNVELLAGAFAEVFEPARNALGELRLPPSQALIDGISTVAEKVNGIVDKAGGIASVVASVRAAKPAITAVAAAVAAVAAAGPALKALSMVGSVASMLSRAAAAAAALASPVGIAVAAVAALAAGFAYLSSTNPGLISSIAEVASSIARTLGGALSQAASLVASLASGLAGALAPMVAAIGSAIGPALDVLGSAFANLAQAVLPLLSNALGIVISLFTAALPVIQMVGSVVGAVASTVITVVANVIAVIVNVAATVASVAAVVLGHLNVALSVVSTVFGAIASVVSAVVSSLVAAISGGFNFIVSAISGAVNSVLVFITTMATRLASSFSTMAAGAVSFGAKFVSSIVSSFGQAVSSVSSALGQAVGTVSSFPGRVLSALGGLGSLLYNSGRSLINGLTNGIKDAIGGAVSAVSGALGKIRGLFPFSPAKYGPFAGKGYTTYSGKALMKDWAKSIVGEVPAAADMVGSALSGIRSQFDVEAAPAQLELAGAGASTTYNIQIDGSAVRSDARLAAAIEAVAEAAARRRGAGTRRG